MPLGDSPTEGAALPRSSSLEQGVHSSDPEILQSIVSDPALSEDLALALLKRSDLPSNIIEQLSKKAIGMTRKIRFALVTNPKTPRHVSVTLVRQLFTFDLMKMALTPVVAADLKIAAKQALMDRLEAVSSGEKLSLARRSSGRVATALLLDPDPKVCRTALDNARLTEAHMTKAVTSPKASAAFIHAVCEHPKWSVRRDVRAALLRTEKLSLSKAVEYAQVLPPALVREILRNSRLPSGIKARVLEVIAEASHSKIHKS